MTPRMLKGIREKLVLAFSLMVLAIATFVVLFFPARLEQQAMRSLIDKAEAIRDQSAFTLSSALFFGDTLGLRDGLDGAAKGAGVDLIVVRDTLGKTVAAQRDSAASADSASATGYVTANGLTYVTSGPVLHGSGRIGTVTVGVSLERVRTAVGEARQLGLLVGLLILLIGSAAAWVIATLLTRPLTAVAETVQRIADGDFSQRAVETVDAEVQQLVRPFNRMVDRFVEAQAELSVINQDLEVRVEHRTAEARTTSEMLQSLIDMAPQVIIAVDTAWHITRWNLAAERLFGWSAAEVLGKEVPFIPAASRAQFDARKRLVETGQGIRGTEVVRVRKDGTKVSVLFSAAPLRDSAAQLVGYIAVVTDLTERKALEEQLHQSQKMEAVGRLAGGVAHDFNNILTVITACAAELLQRTQRPEDRADAEEISTAAVRAKALTRQLLTFSRKQIVNEQDVNLTDVLDEMGPMLRRLLRENIRFTTVSGGRLALINADPTQIEQVIMNLAVNSSDAMPSGGDLTISTENVEITPAEAARHADVAPGMYVALSVKDTGSGMDAATLQKIFEPFFTTKEVGHGTGLGLATTYAIVKRLGGFIDVKSEVGVGTEFRIALPRASVTTPRTARVTPSSPLAPVADDRDIRGSGTILLVEDEAPVRRALTRGLERSGYTVLAAPDGETALTVAADHAVKIDVVVTDLMMPGMNGREFAECLATTHPGMCVVFMSGYADDSVDVEGMVDSAHRFMQKPFNSSQLIRTIQELLASRG